MGALFLYSRKDICDIENAKQVFVKKGFARPELFQFGSCELLLYQKQCVDINNWLRDENGNCICVIGTITYKGLGYCDTLRTLLDDCVNDCININRINGNFCVIFYVGGKVRILNDAQNVQHLFTNRTLSFISSSFLAAAEAVKDKLTLNRPACLEKLTTGYIVGEDTLFNEVTHITKSRQNSGVGVWRFIGNSEITIHSADKCPKIESVAKRTEAVIDYLKDINNISREMSAEIGLSGGYDSRLLYAGTFRAWDEKIDIHTHATEGVAIHQQERKIVKDIAAVKGSNLRIIPTKNMDQYTSDEIERFLKDGLYFFDGRCAYNMGAFSAVYTREYKIEAQGAHRLTLNGLGGEMYRNYYMVARPFINIRQWMIAHIYSSCITHVLNRDAFSKLHKYITHKMSNELPFPWRRWTTKFNVRRYYSELRMPECDALNCNAHNQLSFYLTPFIEKRLVEDAYRARKKIGISGEYQAALIREADADIASFVSHYGFPFSKKEPIKYKLYMIIRGFLPDYIWNLRTNYVMLRINKYSTTSMYFDRVAKKCDYLSIASKYLEELFPEINFNVLKKDYAMKPNMAYTAVLLYEMRHSIKK